MTPLTTTQWASSDKRANPLADLLSDVLDLFAGRRKHADIVPTADGLTTGLIPAGVGYGKITSADANHIAALPEPTEDMLGSTIILQNGATGYELRSNDPTTVGINGGTGAGAESAIAANCTVHATLASLTNWTVFQQTSAGVLTLTQVAAA